MSESPPDVLLPRYRPAGKYDDSIDLPELFRRVRRWWPLVALLLLAGIGLGALLSKKTRPAYESQVRILFPGSMGIGGGLSSLATSLGVDTSKAQPMDMYAEVLKSTRIVNPILQKYDLKRLFKIEIREPEDVNKYVKVETNGKAGALTLTVTAPTSDLAPKMANDLCRSLSQFVKDASISDQQNSSSFLAKRIKEVETRMLKRDEDMKRFQENNHLAGGTVAAAGPPGASVASGRNLTTELTEITANIQANEAKINEVRRQLNTQIETPYRLTEGVGPGKQWREQLNAKTQQLALAEAQFGPEHPRIVLLKKDIAEIRNQIAKEISDARFSLEQGITPELAGLLADRESLRAQRDSLADMLSKIPEQEMRMTQLVRASTLDTTIYAALQQRFQEAQLAEMNDPSRFVFLDRPSIPKRPSRPRWKLNMALGGMAGLLMGCLVALCLPYERKTGGITRPPVREDAVLTHGD